MMSDMPEDARTTLAEALGLEGLPPDEQEQVIALFGEVALKAATGAVLEKLSGDKHEEFARLAEASEPTALSAFLDREVPGHEVLAGQAVAEEAMRFREAVLAPVAVPHT